MANKGPFEAIVRGNEPIANCIYRVRLEFSGDGADAFAKTRAGQFAQLDLSDVSLPALENIPKKLRDASKRNVLLRRPFSFSGVQTQGGKTLVDILYCIVGPSSLRMTTLADGDAVSVIGPLGNGFWIPEATETALLVVGGMGAGPLEHLAKDLRTACADMNIVAFAGARSAADLPFEGELNNIGTGLGSWLKEFSASDTPCCVATDDGSAGHKGFVTNLLCDWLDENDFEPTKTVIYTCGPEIMLEKVAQIASERNIHCQVSMERRMACGIGLCQSCAIECKNESSPETFYKMCCKDGPVFNGNEVVF